MTKTDGKLGHWKVQTWGRVNKLLMVSTLCKIYKERRESKIDPRESVVTNQRSSFTILMPILKSGQNQQQK
jgi:hypothetical protein